MREDMSFLDLNQYQVPMFKYLFSIVTQSAIQSGEMSDMNGSNHPFKASLSSSIGIWNMVA